MDKQPTYCPYCGRKNLVYNDKLNTYLCIDCHEHFEVTEVFYV